MSMSLSEDISPGDHPRTSIHSRGPLAYEHGSADLAVCTCQSLLALGCVWSGSSDVQSQTTVTEFDPLIKFKSSNSDPNPTPNVSSNALSHQVANLVPGGVMIIGQERGEILIGHERGEILIGHERGESL